MEDYIPERKAERSGLRKKAHTVWISIEFLSVQFEEALERNVAVMRRELNLFLGIIFSGLGLLNWSVGKYCDGNTADYLSCTRPEAYYYYGGFQIALSIIGVCLIVIWLLKHRTDRE